MRPKVLIVEDDSMLGQLMGQWLQSDAEVLLTEDAESALELLSRETVDLVVTDVNMPELDGLEFALTIRNRPHGNDVPIIAVSGLDNDDLRLQVLRNVPGLVCLLPKPFEMDVLKAIVNCTIRGDIQGARLLAAGHIRARCMSDD